MFSKKDLNNNWLASNDSEEGKKKNKRGLTWAILKKVIRWGYWIYKILDYFLSD